MKHKKAIVRSIVIVSIILLSVICGFIFQTILDKVDRVNYPQKYSEYVEKYSYEYGIPEYVVYSVMKVESNFDSGAVSADGAVGLMQMMPDTFNWLTSLRQENLDSAMLHDPETNIKYGSYYLSYLYVRYGSWQEVYAAYNAGQGAIDKWLQDESLTDQNGKLVKIPFDETEEYVKKIEKANETYKRLYYTN